MRQSTRFIVVLVLGVLIAACGGTVPTGTDGAGSSGGGDDRGTDATTEPAASLLAEHGGSTGLMPFVEVGSCFWVLGSQPNLTDIVEIVSCDEEHEYEMFAKVDVSGDDWPGEEALQELADEGCGVEPFEDYVAALIDEWDLRPSSVLPTEQEWDSGQRTIQCVIAHVEDETTSEPARDSGVGP